MADAVRRLGTSSWDLILPVPLHIRRQRQRGFNQSALLAVQVSKLLKIPMGSSDCVRIRDTRPQTGLRAAERRKNVAGAFHVPHPERLRALRVLLLDDVLTTGATVNACAQALLEANVQAVWVATLARANLTSSDIL
ncbi:MAG: ComF family protein [Acidobacteria bacterium]|nr:ComF family protein [Acidobacteriota bacterium]